MADKDVKVTEVVRDEDADLVGGVGAARAKPGNPAPAEKSEIVQHEIAQTEDGQAETGKSEIVQHEIAQAEDGQAEIGKSEIVQHEIVEPTARQPEDGPPGSSTKAGETEPGARRGWRAAAALGAVAVVLAGFGVWATLHASSLRSNADAQANTALTDGQATATVRREISAAINTIFSYNYADTAATRRAAQRMLTGPAVRQYNTLFALVTKNAPAQKLIVTTKVTNSGVELLNGDRARLLVFANQQDTRAGTGQTSYAGAMFAVTALRQGGRWKIENIDTFNG